MTTATPDLVTELDEDTDTQRTCELRKGKAPAAFPPWLSTMLGLAEFADCGQPATWVFTWKCANDHAHRLLACDDCHDSVVANPEAVIDLMGRGGSTSNWERL